MGQRFLRTTTVALLAAFAAACGSSSSPTYSSEITATTEGDGATATADFVQMIADVPGMTPLEDMMQPGAGAEPNILFYGNAIAWLARRVIDGYSVKAMAMNYQGRAFSSAGAQVTRTLSGAVFIPKPALLWDISVPIVVYTHGTELQKNMVASKGITDEGYESDLGGLEGYLGMNFASAGPAIVVMPDYQGMGTDDKGGYHPYVQQQSLAWAGIDMAKAVIERLKTDTGFAPKGTTWNGKLYVMGYSEGGYSALAFTRQWVMDNGEAGTGIPLHCAAPMAGPHSVSEEMLGLMLDDTRTFPVPFFLPYMLYGYNAVYPSLIKPRDAIVSKYFEKGLDSWMSGRFSGSFANKQIIATNGGPVVMPTMLVPAWADANLRDPESAVYKTLLANDNVARPGAANAWSSPIPIYFIHSRTDDLVPFGNSSNAYTWMAESPGGVHLRTVNWSYFGKDFNPGHGDAGPAALAGGFWWLMHDCKE
jgi:hypothetical protein